MSIRNINWSFHKYCMFIKYFITRLCVFASLRNKFFRLKALITLIAIFSATNSIGQSNFGLKLLSVNINPFENKYFTLYTKTIDNEGIFLFEPGVLFSYEYFVNIQYL